MERRHHLGLDSYDRIFPNQDNLPKGGFGNLIALPLQSMPRQHGNSLFGDDDVHPYPDQWQLLVSNPASWSRLGGMDRQSGDSAWSGHGRQALNYR